MSFSRKINSNDFLNIQIYTQSKSDKNSCMRNQWVRKIKYDNRILEAISTCLVFGYDAVSLGRKSTYLGLCPTVVSLQPSDDILIDGTGTIPAVVYVVDIVVKPMNFIAGLGS